VKNWLQTLFFQISSTCTGSAEVKRRIDGYQEKGDLFRKYQSLFKMPENDFSNLQHATKEFEGKHDTWTALHAWETSSASWMSSAADGLDLADINATVDDAGTAAYKMLKQRRDDQVVMRLREQIDSFKQYLPLLQEVANPALLPRHWERIFTVLGHTYSETEPFSCATLLESGIMEKMEQVETIGGAVYKSNSADLRTCLRTCLRICLRVYALVYALGSTRFQPLSL
jgi:dynein heavy chain